MECKVQLCIVRAQEPNALGGQWPLGSCVFPSHLPSLCRLSVPPLFVRPYVVCPSLRRLSTTSSYVRRPLDYLHFWLHPGFFGLIWILMELGSDELLIVHYMCCCFSARFIQERIPDWANKGHICLLSCTLSLQTFHFDWISIEYSSHDSKVVTCFVYLTAHAIYRVRQNYL